MPGRRIAGATKRRLPDCCRNRSSSSAADNLIGVARAIPGNPTAPAILHLLNRNYDASTDTTAKMKNVKVSLHKGIFDGRTLAKATLYAPPPSLDRQNPGASEAVPLHVEPTSSGVTVTIPELDYWGILKVE